MKRTVPFSIAFPKNKIKKFIPRYFILWDAIANEILLFISRSDSSLLVYRN